MPFGMEKLEWLGYPMVKKDMFIRFDRMHERFSCECGSTILGLPQVKDGNNHPFVSYGVFRVWARDLDLLALK